MFSMVLANIILMKQIETRQAGELRLQESLGRIRENIISVKKFSNSDMPWTLIPDEIRGLGIPILGVSIEVPAPSEGSFLCHPIGHQRQHSGQLLLEEYPWVRDAWESGKPIQYTKVSHGADHPLFVPNEFPGTRTCLVEIPIPGVGSAGFSSDTAESFDSRTIDILTRFAELFGLAWRRAEDFNSLETSYQREQAMGRLRDIIVQARSKSDFTEFANEFIEELRRLGVPVLPHFSLERPAADGDDKFEVIAMPAFVQVKSGLALADHRWVREAWERNEAILVSRQEFDQLWNFEGRKNWLVEIPLPGLGSMGFGSREVEPFTPEQIHTLQSFCGLVTESWRRVEDFVSLQRSEEEFRWLVENAGDALFLADADLNLITVNQAAWVTIGRNCSDFKYPTILRTGL